LIPEWLPVLAIITPLTAGFILIALGSFTTRRIQGLIAIAASSLTLLFAAQLYQVVVKGVVIVHKMSGWDPPFGIILAVDALNGFVAVVVAGVVLLAAIYSIDYMSHDDGLHYYFALLMLMLSGMMGITLTGDIFNLFVFYELASISAYSLVAFRSREAEPLEAGFKYMAMGAVATTFILFGVGILYSLIGTVNMADLARRIAEGSFIEGTSHAAVALPIVIGILIWGFGIKSAIFPLHTWLPDAHPAAPSPVSAILSGVFIKVGIYATIRLLFTIYGISAGEALLLFIATIGVVTIVIAGFIALAQTDIKRLFAFSSVMNVGYIFFGVGVGTALGLTGALYHLVNHAIVKCILFFVAGAIIHQTGIRDMTRMGGLSRKMPLTMVVFLIGGFGIAGVPPFNGFMSKWILLQSAIELGGSLYIAYAAVAAAMSGIAVAYIMKALWAVFLGQPHIDISGFKDPPLTMMIPMIILAIASILLGIFPQWGLNLVSPAVEAALNQASYITQIFG